MRFLLRLTVLAVIFAGIAVGAIAGWEMWQRAQETDSATGLVRIDYNGALPGCGNPWLMQVMAGPYSERQCPEFQEMHGPTVGDCSEEFPLPGWFWVLGSPDIDMVYLPVPIDESGFARSWADVYELASRHPQLGGTGLTAMTEAEVEALGHWGDGWYRSEGPAPNGGTNKYLLPTLTAETLDLMTIEGESGMCGQESRPVVTAATTTTSASTTTTEPPERQQWRIFAWGHERTGFDPATPSIRPRAGVRFEYRLYGEFVVERSEPERPWRYVSGRVTDAKIEIIPIFELPDLWEMKPYDCRGCDRVIRERSLPVTFVGGNDILVKWGSFMPSVNIEARLCPPDADCTAWGTTYFESESFLGSVSETVLELRDGYTATSQPGNTRVKFTIGLDQVP